MEKEFKVSVTTHFDCSLERAFKTPFLSDVTKVHTGYGLMPRVTGCTDDADWGRPGSTKKIFVGPSLTHKGGFASIDKVLERVENQYWRIEVSDFQSWMLGFDRFIGEWTTTPVAPGRIKVNYTYWLRSRSPLFFPFNGLFARLFWKKYMQHVLENIRAMIANEEPYLHD